MIDEWGKDAKYWDYAWNPVIGCEKVSEGCANCYAARLAAQYPELKDDFGGFDPHPPKHLKRPPQSGVVFVGNMTDIFGDWNCAEEVCEWLGALSERAVNLILTKRAENMINMILGKNLRLAASTWLGVTAENQKRLEERCCDFHSLSANRWISIEPMLERIDLTVLDSSNDQIIDHVDWVVVGAESGPNRRPCSLDWVRQIVQQCQKAEVPVFVKQLDIAGKLVKDIAQFPGDLQIRQVPWRAWRER